MRIVSFVLIVGLVGCTCAADCEDVDTKSCELLAAKRSDICTDPCLSKMCTRYCGHCPVKCYECHEIDDPTNCTNVVTCPSKDHYCYTTQTFADDFTEVYKLGCAMKTVCQTYIGSRENRNIDLNGACCTQDKCNNDVPLLIMTATQQSTPTPAQSPVSTSDPNSCKNIDDSVCQRMSQANAAMCSDSCFAEICPQMCGRCFNCYTCNDMENIGDCNTTHTCQSGEECFSLETLSFDLRPVFRVGCMTEQLCTRFTSGPSVIGKRDGFSLKGGCCKTDLCNSQVEPVNVQTTTTTASPTSHCQVGSNRCPAGFLFIDSSCYKIGNQRMSWIDAKSYCESNCGRLVDFSSRRNMLDVFQFLVPHKNGIYQDERIWTDATYSNRHWTWNHNGHVIDSREFRHLTSSHSTRFTCGEATVHTSGSLFPTTTEDIVAANCLNHYLPLCEAQFS